MRLEEIRFKQAPTNLGTLGMLLNLQAADRDWDGSDQTLAHAFAEPGKPTFQFVWILPRVIYIRPACNGIKLWRPL